VPFPPVVVDISPPESPPELRRSLLEACSRAVKSTGCVERNAAGSTEGGITATVRWSGGGHVRLEVTLATSNQKVEREIEFAAHDALGERWRTTGLVVGTLASVLSRNELPSVGELPAPPETPTPEAKAPEPEPAPEPRQVPAEPDPRKTLLVVPRARPHKPRPEAKLFVDLSALMAPAIVGGPMRLGGEVGGRIRFGNIPVEPAVAVAYSETLADLDGVAARFFDAFIGFAVTGNLGGPFSTVARGEGFFRWLETSTSPSGSLGPISAARVVGGARVGLDGLVRVADPLSLFVGGAGIFAAGSTDVTIHRRVVGSVPALSYEVRAGLSFEF
jgi:hypothetical protein